MQGISLGDATDFATPSQITFVGGQYSPGATLSDPTTLGTTYPAYFGPNFEFAAAAAATPEPGSFALLGTGLLGFVGVIRRRLS